MLVPDGARLSGVWSNGSGLLRTYNVRFVVPDGATLSVRTNGAENTFAAGAHDCRFASADDVAVEFASVGELLKYCMAVGCVVQ